MVVGRVAAAKTPYMTDHNEDQNSIQLRQGRRPAGTETVRIYGEMLRRARKARGLSGEAMLALVEQAGVKMSLASLYSFERSMAEPTPDVARIIGAVYGVPIEQLLEIKPIEPANLSSKSLEHEELVDKFMAQLDDMLRQARSEVDKPESGS